MTGADSGYDGPGSEWLGTEPKWATARGLAAAVWSTAQARYAGAALQHVEQALRLAAELHRAKVRPDGSPYLQHVLSVAQRTLRWLPEASCDVAVAALLHDTVEDESKVLAIRARSSAGTERERALQAIDETFGGRVAELVGQLTNPNFEAQVQAQGLDPKSSPGTLAQHKLYAEHFEQLLQSNDHATLIKVADFSDNALRLDGIIDRVLHAKLTGKYRACVALLREHTRAAEPASMLFGIRSELLNEIETAWARDYAQP